MFFMLFIVALILVAGFLVFGTYNKLVSQIESVENAKRSIDIQLDRRFKVFENLVNVVKKVMDYEQTTLKEVIALRNEALKAQSAGDEGKRMEMEERISGIASNIRVVFEQYPELKANQNAQQLQEEIVSTENKLSFSKQHYNDSIQEYNTYKKSFFTSILIGAFFQSLNKHFEYWGLSAQKQVQYEEKMINF